MIIEYSQEKEELLSAPLLAIEQLGTQLGPSLFLAPHPDDEALGCGGLIFYLRSQNIPVTVVFVTSGDASHPNSMQYPPPLLGSLREKEALKSCEILGVTLNDVIFLRYPDGALKNLEKEEQTELANKVFTLMVEREISSVFMPWRRDVHPDHKMTSVIGHEAVEKCIDAIQIVEYPIWLWKTSAKEDWPVDAEVSAFRLNVDAVLSQKSDAIFAHKSQTTTFITDDPTGFILTVNLLATFLGSFEYYFFSKHQKMSSIGQQFFDTLYSESDDPWNFKHSGYELSKYKKTDEILGDIKFKNGLELGCSIGIQTRFFANRCEKLLAIDISKEAVHEAIKNTSDLHNVNFRVQDIAEKFPRGSFDFISMCEIGYYFDQNTLLAVFEKINENLSDNGQFLMVHWTSYVREYPLNGKQVNIIFQQFNALENQFSLITSYIHESYELHLYKK